MEMNVLSNPFPGLRPFEADEEHLFFGREREVDGLLRRLRATRFLLVAGSSGTGKSSLVRSGLVPALESGFMLQAGSSWRIAIFRPGDNPIGNLAAALDAPDVLGTTGELAETNRVLIDATLHRSSLGIAQAVRQAHIPAHDNVLVMVDQFEELFRFRRSGPGGNSTNEAVAFFKLLLEASSQKDVPIYVVLTMRSDFLGDCIGFQGLPEAINQGLYLIPRMTRDELRSAIASPVAVAGGGIAQRLVLRMLNDLGDNQDQLPLLQHALMRTWDHWALRREQAPEIDLADYESIGGLQHALSIHAEEAFQEAVSLGDGQIAETMFKALTDTYSDFRGVRRACSIAELAAVCEVPEADVARVVEIFRRPGRSFLTPYAGVALEPDTIVDLSHESLMRCWTRLAAWTEEERESAVVYMRISQAAQWFAESTGALWIDPQLETGLQWRRANRPTAAWAERYDSNFALAMDFLDRSRQQREVERQKEAARKRARQVAIYVLAGLLLAIGTLAGVAYRQTLRAKQNLSLAEQAVDASLSSAGAQQSREFPDSPELEDFRRQLLDKAKTFYVSFTQEEPSSETIAAQVAMGHSRLGDIYRLLELNQDAVDEYNKAIAGFGKLAQQHPAKADYRQQLAYAHNWLGETLRLWLESAQKPTQYTAADARTQYDAAIALQQQLQQGAPANPDYLQDLARSYNNRGILLNDVHSADSEADFLRAASLLHLLAGVARPASATASSEPDPAQDLAHVNNNLGMLDLQGKEYAKAVGLFQQAIAGINGLRQKDSVNSEYKTEAATYYNNLALALGYEHEFALAAQSNESARQITDELAAPSPELQGLQSKVAKLQAWIIAHK